MRPSFAIRERPYNQLYPPRRRIRAYELPVEHAGEALNLGRVFGGVALGVAHGVYAQGECSPKMAEIDFADSYFPNLGQSTIQTPQHSQQRRNHRPRPRRRRLPPFPHKHRNRALRPRTIRHHLENQAIRRRKGIPHARRARPPLRQGRR